jgi:hypothetical protein
LIVVTGAGSCAISNPSPAVPFARSLSIAIAHPFARA